MADEIVQKFSALERADRLHALQKLVGALSTEERTFTCNSISQRNDPFQVLPVELILQIFGHLSLFRTWTLQRVCKQWRKTLSSEDILRSAIARWRTEDPSDSVRQGSTNDAIYNTVQHIQAARLGIPLSERIFDRTGTGLQGPQPKLSHRRFDFKGRYIAYISSHQGQGDAVVVRDLINGHETTLRGEARERILLVILTTSLAAFVTFEGCLYVWQFTSSSRMGVSRIQLPSSAIRAAGGDGHNIALAMAGTSSFPYVSSVVTYNAEDGHLKNLVVESSCADLQRDLRRLDSCGILVDSQRGSIDVFSLYYIIVRPPRRIEPGKYLLVYRFRIAFDGQWQSWNTWKVSIDFETSMRPYQFLMGAPCSTGIKNLYRIMICEVPFMGGLPFRRQSSVLFDAESSKFVPDDSDPSRALNSNASSEYGDAIETEMNVLWKDRLHRPRIPNDWLEYIFYMNDTFMVSLEVSKLHTQHSRIRVFCFDPNIHMADSKIPANRCI